jgi:hypothetical protein
LIDDENNVRYLFVRNLKRTPIWRAIYEARERLDGPLAGWFRTLPEPPKEVVILGSIGMTLASAKAIYKVLAEWFPDAIKDESSRGKRRAVGKVEPDGRLTIWRSQTEAAAHLGVTKWSVWQQAQRGTLLDLPPLRGQVNDALTMEINWP